MSFSIWSLLSFLPVLLFFSGAYYVVYNFAKRKPPNTQTTDGPAGVGGWLLVLVGGMMFLGPLMSVLRLSGDLTSAESLHPTLATLETWRTYKSATWGTQLITACLSFYAGLSLAKRRDVSVVTKAKIILWVIGPGASVVMGLVIPLLVFGKIGATQQFAASLIATVIVAGIWTSYLSKSKRVQATYGRLH